MDRIQFRRDTLDNWNRVNPILLEGEIGYVLDDPNRYKMGDGVHTWDQLPFRGFDGTIVHNTGDSENAVMSQKATSKAIHGILYDVSAHNNGAVFESLSALLSSSNLSTLIPTSVRHGGMSIRFIQSSDNKYVQYLLTKDEWSTTTTDWEKINLEDEVNQISGQVNVLNYYGLPLRKGSPGSLGSAGMVTTCYVPLRGRKVVSVLISRPNTTGYNYAISYALTSSYEDIGTSPLNSNAKGLIYSSSILSDGVLTVDVSAYPDAVGIIFGIVEHNSGGYNSSLLPSDYDGYEVCVDTQFVTKKEIEDVNNSIVLDKTIILSQAKGLSLRKGSPGSAGSTGFVTTQYTLLNGIKKFTVKLDRPNTEGYKYVICYTLTSSYSDIGTLKFNSQLDGLVYGSAIDYTGNLTIDISSYPSAIGISVGIGEYNGSSFNTSLLPADFDNYPIVLGCQIATVLRTNDNKDNIMALWSKGLSLRAGSPGSLGSTGFVTACYIPLNGQTKVTLKTDRPNTSGYKYCVVCALTTSYKDIYKLPTNGNAEGYIYGSSVSSEGVMSVDVSEYPNAVGIMMGICERHSGYSYNTALKPSDFDNYPITLSCQFVTKQEMADNIENVAARNRHILPILSNACRWNKGNNGNKDFMSLIVTDSHEDNTSVKNAVSLANDFGMFDCLIHCGDAANNRNESYKNSFLNIMATMKKPWFFVPGNHDVGNTKLVSKGLTHQTVYDWWIKPIVDAGILANTEYESGLSYYYHDFASRKTRVIFIYEYQEPLDVADNEYWEEVTYNSSYEKMQAGTTYTYDSGNPTILNCGDYTDYSFKLKQTVTTVETEESGTMPLYKVKRGNRVIMQDQAEWLISVLKSTPSDYGVIVVCHNPAMINAENQRNMKFGTSGNTGTIGGKAYGQYDMTTDLLSDILNAFVNKNALSLKVVMSGGAAYLNTLNDGEIDYCYELSDDFSQVNSGVYFSCFISGHTHVDLIYKHNTYEHLYSINPICSSANGYKNEANDVARSVIDELDYDAITCVSVKKDRVALARLGNDKTMYAEARDFEVFNPNA